MSIKLKKGESASVLSDGVFKVCIGWKTKCDLDLHAYVKSSLGTEHIFYGNRWDRRKTVYLSPDNTTGRGNGDLEVCKIDYKGLDSSIYDITFKLHIYSPYKRFKDIKGAFIRIIDENGIELCRRDIDKMGIKKFFRTYTFGKLTKNKKTGAWTFKAN